MHKSVILVRVTMLISLYLVVVSCSTGAVQSKGYELTVHQETQGRDPNGEVDVEGNGEPGIVKDLRLMRSTVRLNQCPPVQVSTYETIEAAKRVFDRLKFVGMSKEDVLWAIGDPSTISDYGIKAAEGEDKPLVYRFSNGFDGIDYVVEFKNGLVVKVRTEGID